MHAWSRRRFLRGSIGLAGLGLMSGCGVLPSRTQQDHADHPRAGQGVRDHLAVARLEDVERERDLRKEHDVRQREQRDDRRNGRQESSAPVLGAPASGR